MLDRSVLIVRGFAAPRLAKFAKTLWIGSEVGLIAASFSPGMSAIAASLRQVIPALFKCRTNGSKPVSFETTKQSLGVAVDKRKALHWHRKAAAQDNRLAPYAIDDLEREGIK